MSFKKLISIVLCFIICAMVNYGIYKFFKFIGPVSWVALTVVTVVIIVEIFVLALIFVKWIDMNEDGAHIGAHKRPYL